MQNKTKKNGVHRIDEELEPKPNWPQISQWVLFTVKTHPEFDHVRIKKSWRSVYLGRDCILDTYIDCRLG